MPAPSGALITRILTSIATIGVVPTAVLSHVSPSIIRRGSAGNDIGSGSIAAISAAIP